MIALATLGYASCGYELQESASPNLGFPFNVCLNDVMNRRDFMLSSLLASGSALMPENVISQTASPRSPVRVNLLLDTEKTGHTILPSFLGLSYEQAELRNPSFFSLQNKQLIGFLCRLGKHGVLRIGGNSSDFLSWNEEAQSRGSSVDSNEQRKSGISQIAIQNLGDFLKQTGWRLIYGLNLGHGTPQQAAHEAAYVMETIGRDRLLAFQIGNEPDEYSKNGMRKPSYSFDSYVDEWKSYFHAVRQRRPDAPFAGPDTAYNTQWVVEFAEKFQSDLKFVSSHYYAEGPPSNPGMNIARLLHGTSTGLTEEVAAISAVKAKTGLSFRLTEANSCYGGGKWGVSDTFASALWAVDLMYEQATVGGVGINFHEVAYKAYSSLVGTLEAGFLARPAYYGLLLFSEAGPGQLVQIIRSGSQAIPLLTTYALRGIDGRIRIVLINKDTEQNAQVNISGVEASKGRVLRLEAPRVDDTTDVTFGCSPVGPCGEWSPQIEESLRPNNGNFHINIAKATAALVEFS